MEAYVRSVGRRNHEGRSKGLLGLFARFRRVRPRDDYVMDLRDRGEDVWSVLRY